MASFAEDVATWLHRRLRKDPNLTGQADSGILRDRGWQDLTPAEKEVFRRVAVDFTNWLSERSSDPTIAVPDGKQRVGSYLRKKPASAVRDPKDPVIL